MDEVEPYLTSEPLAKMNTSVMKPTVISSENGTIYEHCLRAIDKALVTNRGTWIALIGVGDWNDGMNLVGAKGRGESVWLGWFICDILNVSVKFAQNA